MNRNIALLLTASALFVMIGAGCSLASRTDNIDTNNTEKSFTEYFATREQFDNSEMERDVSGMNKNPDQLGFIELAKTTVTCPDSAGTPCSGEVLILSKDALHSGDQEFYLAQTAGFGYTYYGPFTDDLERIIAESKEATLVAGATSVVDDTNTPDIISKTFESEEGRFSYTLHWSPKLNTLLETALPEASEHAPSFNIVGGGTITVATGWIDSPGYNMAAFINDTYYNGEDVFPSAEPKPISAGTTYPVYYFEQTPKESSSTCWVKYAVIKDLNEALAVRMEDCTGSDRTVTSAFADIYGDLEIVSKEIVSK